MKVKVSTHLISGEEEIHSEKLGILDSRGLRFQENGTKVFLSFSEDVLIRENEELYLRYVFLKNRETLNEVTLKKENYRLPLLIHTLELMHKENFYYVKYRLQEERKEVTYQVSWEEVK